MREQLRHDRGVGVGELRGDLRPGDKLYHSTAALRAHVPNSYLPKSPPVQTTWLELANLPVQDRKGMLPCVPEPCVPCAEKHIALASLLLHFSGMIHRWKIHARALIPPTRTVPSNPEVTILSSSNSRPATASWWSPTLQTWFQSFGV